MAKKNTKKKSKKGQQSQYQTVILFLLLPILAVVIGFFGTQVLLNITSPIISVDESQPPTSTSVIKVTETGQEQTTTATATTQEETSQTSGLTYDLKLPELSLYALQLGSFASPENAEKFQLDLMSKGIPSAVYVSDTYKVVSLSSTSRNALITGVEKLDLQGNNYFISNYLLSPALKGVDQEVNKEDLLACAELINDMIDSHGDMVKLLSYSDHDKTMVATYRKDLQDKITRLDGLLQPLIHESVKNFVAVAQAISSEFEYYHEHLEYAAGSNDAGVVWEGILTAIYGYGKLGQ